MRNKSAAKIQKELMNAIALKAGSYEADQRTLNRAK